jgi:CarD family transcriptional regulator
VTLPVADPDARTTRRGRDGVQVAKATPDSVFKVGAKVVYPAHGVAEIVRRDKREFGGETKAYLVLEVPQQGWGTAGAMTVSVPEDGAAELGVRAAIDREDADDVLDVLAVRDVRMPSNWSRRFKNHQEKLKSGDVYQCAEVVRNLAFRLRTAKLSTAEQSMYAKARYILTSELAVSWGIDDAAAEARIDEVLGLTPTTS